MIEDLRGARLVITRAAEDALDWERRIRAAHGEPIAFPCVRIEPIEHPAGHGSFGEALARCGWLALSSPRSAELAARLLEHEGAPLHCHVAAVGPATAEACLRELARCDLVAEPPDAAGLAAGLALRLPREGGRILVAGAENGRREFEEQLEPRGIEVERWPLYRTVAAEPEAKRFRLARLKPDAVLLGSPSAVAGLLARAELEPGLACVAIGPSTERAARAAGLAPLRRAARPSLDAMLEAILDLLPS